MTQDKKTEAREWWIPEDCEYPTAFNNKKEATSWAINQEQNIGHQCHIFHVIEYSAYHKLREENEALRKAVEYYAKGECLFITGEVNTKPALEVLAKYPRGEKW
jgi:hypothetical protein